MILADADQGLPNQVYNFQSVEGVRRQEVGERRAVRALHEPGWLVERNGCGPPPPPPRSTVVERDAIEPGGKAAGIAQIGERLERREKSLLRYVLGILAVAQKP